VQECLRRCATSLTVPGSIPGGVTGFFSDISFRPYHGPGVDSAPSENEYQEHFLRVKAAGAWRPHYIHVPNVMEIWKPKPPGTLWATPGLLRVSFTFILYLYHLSRRSQWPRDLRRRSSTASLLRLWIRIPPEAWMFFCCECCVLLGRGLCDGLITPPEESYGMWRVVVCDQETSKTRRLKPATGLWKYSHNGL